MALAATPGWGRQEILDQAEFLLQGAPGRALDLVSQLDAEAMDPAQQARHAWLRCESLLAMGRAGEIVALAQLPAAGSPFPARLALCRSRAAALQGDLALAREQAEASLRAASGLGDAGLEAAALLNHAELHTRIQDYETALASLQRAYEYSHALPDGALAGQVINAIATLYYNTGRLDQAGRYYEELVQRYAGDEDNPALSVALFNRAHVLASRRDFARAEADLRRSLALSRQLDDGLGAAYSLKALGVNAQAMGALEAAAGYLRQALDGFRARGEATQAAAVLRHLGDIALQRRQFEAAVASYGEALPVLAAQGSEPALLRTWRGLAGAYEQLGRWREALQAQQNYTHLLRQDMEARNADTVRSLQEEFETRRMADDNARLARQNQRQQQDLRQQRALTRTQALAIGLGGCILALVGLMWWRSRQLAGKLHALATTDDLTGLLNRRAMMQRGMREWRRSERFERPLACLLFDVDAFKSVNDRWGHAAGDRVLQIIAGAVQGSLRRTDILGRFGGEEFLLIAPETRLPEALAMAERIRASLEQISHEVIGGRPVTVSLGISIRRRQGSLEELISQADQALYDAKQAGRNRAVVYHEESEALGGMAVVSVPVGHQQAAAV